MAEMEVTGTEKLQLSSKPMCQCRKVNELGVRCKENVHFGIFCKDHEPRVLEVPLKKAKKVVNCEFIVEVGKKPSDLLVIGLFPKKKNGYESWLKDQLIENDVFEGFTLVNIFPYVAEDRMQLGQIYVQDRGNHLIQENLKILKTFIAKSPRVLFGTGSYSKGNGEIKQEFMKLYECCSLLLQEKHVYCFGKNEDGKCSNFGKFHHKKEKVELKQVKFVHC